MQSRSQSSPKQRQGEPEARRGLRVVPLGGDFLLDAVRLHLLGLGYTMNSKLGRQHLGWLYRFMAKDDQCYVGLALLDEQPVGIVSGTINAETLNSRLLSEMPMGRMLLIALKFLAQPRLFSEFRKSKIIARAVYWQGREVRAVLTTLSVDPGVQARGIGSQLVAALEAWFAPRGVLIYRLDTLLENRGAREFYRKLGFCELEERADSVVFLKAIGT